MNWDTIFFWLGWGLAGTGCFFFWLETMAHAENIKQCAARYSRLMAKYRVYRHGEKSL